MLKMPNQPETTEKARILEAVAARFFLLEARCVPNLTGVSPEEIKDLWGMASDQTKERCRASAEVAWNAVLHVMKKRRELKPAREIANGGRAL
jgi:hypothetical protein